MQDIEKEDAMEIPAGGSLEIGSSSFTPYSGSFAPPSDSFGKEFFGAGMSREFGRSRYDGYKEGSDSAGTSDTDQPAKVGGGPLILKKLSPSRTFACLCWNVFCWSGTLS